MKKILYSLVLAIGLSTTPLTYPNDTCETHNLLIIAGVGTTSTILFYPVIQLIKEGYSKGTLSYQGSAFLLAVLSYNAVSSFYHIGKCLYNNN